MSEWKPIYTAPKDGTKVLLHYPGHGWIEGAYDAKYTCWEPLKLSSHGCGCCSYDNEPPDAWCDLPTPPEAKP